MEFLILLGVGQQASIMTQLYMYCMYLVPCIYYVCCRISMDSLIISFVIVGWSFLLDWWTSYYLPATKGNRRKCQTRKSCQSETRTKGITWCVNNSTNFFLAEIGGAHCLPPSMVSVLQWYCHLSLAVLVIFDSGHCCLPLLRVPLIGFEFPVSTSLECVEGCNIKWKANIADGTQVQGSVW